MTYVTVAELKTERNIVGSGDDSIVAAAVDDAKAYIDSYCHRTFEGNVSSRTFDAAADVEGSFLWVYGAGDLSSISSITNGNGDTVAGSAYTTQPRNAVARGKPIIGIHLKQNSSVYWRTADNGVPEDAITVSGVWAYSNTPPADIARAAKMLAFFYYDQRMSSGGEIAVIPGVSVKIPTGIPAAVKQILANYIRETF
jgi:hypothetical protein